MQAYVIEAPGGPEALLFREIPRPASRDGWVLIRVRAFGLNRSEWFTRRGDSPNVRFPRVLGIECVGEVVSAPGSDLEEGQRVAALMGGMGREFDGSYAEYTLIPRANVFEVKVDLPWDLLGAFPEMLQTTHGSLHVGLEIERASSLLIRGGTSSIGMMALALGRAAGLRVTTTTRSAAKSEILREAGAHHVLLDDGAIATAARELEPDGFDRVLELVGATTLLDSLRAAGRGGIVCMTGILGGQWVLPTFHPMGDVPTGVKLTSYSGEASDITAQQLNDYLGLVAAGEISVKLGPVFGFDDLQQAHANMDANRAGGKMVILVP